MTTTKTDFVLRHIAREILDTSLLVEPRDLAAELMARLSPDDYAAALAQALPVFMRQVLSEDRRGRTFGSSTNFNGSPKVAAVRNGWQRALRQRIKTGDGMKFLGDCTIADLLAAAELRDEMARRNASKATQYRSLAGELMDAGVDRVKDLPPQTMAMIFGAAA